MGQGISDYLSSEDFISLKLPMKGEVCRVSNSVSSGEVFFPCSS